MWLSSVGVSHSLARCDRSVCDAGWLGTDELTAVAFAQLVINITGVALWAGAGDALVALTAQAIGADNPKLAGIWLQTAIVSIAGLTLPISVVWWFTGDILSLCSGPSQHVQHLASTFTRWSLIWLMPDAVVFASCQWLNGMQLVRCPHQHQHTHHLTVRVA